MSEEVFDKIHGRIIDAETKAPVPFAKILFSQIDVGVIADIDGKFEYQGMLSNPLKVEVRAIGYETKELELKANDFHEIIIKLTAVHLMLDEVQVTARTGVIERTSIANVEVRKFDELSPLTIRNVTDGLTVIPGVYNQSLGAGIGKPVVRGLSGMRVVTYLNSLRIENQQWGADHGLGIGTLGVGQVEVVKGPSSLLYGPDAMGGTLYISDEPYAPVDEVHIGGHSLFESADMSVQNQLSAKYSQHRFRLAVYGQQNNAADYQIPDGRYVSNSRFRQEMWKLAMGVNRRSWFMNVRYAGLLNRFGLPGHTHSANPQTDDFLSNEQKRRRNIPAQENTNHYISIENNFHRKRGDLNLNLGYSSNRLLEYEEAFSFPGIAMMLRNATYNLRYRHDATENLQLLLGAQGMFSQTRNIEDAEEQLMPNSSLLDNGVYALAHLTTGRWSTQVGVRADQRQLESFHEFKGNDRYKNSFEGLNFSAGTARESKNWIWRLSVSSGFRPPHMNELLANGVHHGSNRYEIGSISLVPERGTQADLSAEYRNEHLQIRLNPFFSDFQNLISLQATGLAQNGLFVYEYESLSSVQMYGVDANLHYHPHFAHRLHIDINGSYLSTTATTTTSPFPFLPPSRVQSLLTYHLMERKKGFNIHALTIQHQYFFAQNLIAEFEQPSQAYQLFNIGLQMEWKGRQNMVMETGVRNALNQRYVDHLSNLKTLGIPGQGRSVYVQIKVNLKQKVKHKHN